MVNDISLPLPSPDVNADNSIITNHQPLIDGNDPIVSVSQDYQAKPSSSYLSLSVGDNRQFGSSNFQDPLFYQQPLHLHYNQSLPFKIGSEHETGDRVRMTNNFKLNEYRKQRSATSQKHRIEKSKPTYRSKKSKSKIVKTKEKKKKASRRNLKERKQKRKIINRNSIQQLRSQKKKKLLKQRIGSKKRSISKVNRKNTLTSRQYARKSNTTNNRMASTISNTQIASDQIKQQSIFNPVRQSNGTEIINEVKHLRPTLSNVLFSKLPSATKLERNSSKKGLRRSKLNVRKLSTSKSKQRKRGGTKLNIRSPVQTTFKKNVRRYRNRRSTRRKIKFPRCTSKTLITMGKLNTNSENMIKPMDIQNDDIRTKISSSLFSLKNNLTHKQSTMPLTKNCAQLTSKNNNRRTIKIKRQRNISISKRKLKKSTKR